MYDIYDLYWFIDAAVAAVVATTMATNTQTNKILFF